MVKSKYTLQYCIEHNNRFKRKAHVIKVLTDNDILNWQDFILGPIPTKGLWKSEVKILLEMQKKERMINEMKWLRAYDLKNELSKYFSKHETTRVFNILKSHNIYGIRALMVATNLDLYNMHGIGDKTIDILMHMKEDLWKFAESCYSDSSEQNGNYVAQPLLAGLFN